MRFFHLWLLLLAAVSGWSADLGLGPLILTPGAANGAATLDAAGLLTFAQVPTVRRLTASDCGAHAVSTGTSETVLKTFSFTAANLPTISANSNIIVRTLWTYTNSANNKTLRARIGAAGAGTGGSALWAQINTTSATAGRDLVIFVRATNSEVMSPLSASHEGTSTVALTTTAIDLTANWEIALTGQTASSGETIQLEATSVEIMTP